MRVRVFVVVAVRFSRFAKRETSLIIKVCLYSMQKILINLLESLMIYLISYKTA